MSITGRPTRYRPEYCQLAHNYCRLGATAETLGELLGVTSRSIENWIARIPEFADAVQRGRNMADAQVAESLYRRATGYERTVEHTVRWDGQERTIAEKVCYPPETQACSFWLRNRRPQNLGGRVSRAREKTEQAVFDGVAYRVSLAANDNGPPDPSRDSGERQRGRCVGRGRARHKSGAGPSGMCTLTVTGNRQYYP